MKKKQGKDCDLSQFRAQLDALGLKIIQVTADGNCFFRSVFALIIEFDLCFEDKANVLDLTCGFSFTEQLLINWKAMRMNTTSTVTWLYNI